MKKVTIYTLAESIHTEPLKQYLKSKNCKFDEIDLSKNEDETEKLIRKTGYATVPQIEINGQFIVGFDKNKLDELLS